MGQVQDIDTDRVREAWAAMRTRRWHADTDLVETDDRVDGHSGRVALLAHMLFPDVPVLMTYAALHDVGEAKPGPGDVSHTVKRRHPDLARMVEQMEVARRAELGVALPLLDADDRLRFELCDRLDGYLWIQRACPGALMREDVVQDFQWLVAAAHELGLEDVVMGLVE